MIWTRKKVPRTLNIDCISLYWLESRLFRSNLESDTLLLCRHISLGSLSLQENIVWVRPCISPIKSSILFCTHFTLAPKSDFASEMKKGDSLIWARHFLGIRSESDYWNSELTSFLNKFNSFIVCKQTQWCDLVTTSKWTLGDGGTCFFGLGVIDIQLGRVFLWRAKCLLFRFGELDLQARSELVCIRKAYSLSKQLLSVIL